MDKDVLHTLLITWNPHFIDPARGKWEGTIRREKYLERLKLLMDIPHVVILSGVRRAGKSTLMHQTMEYLIEEKGGACAKCRLSIFGRHTGSAISFNGMGAS